MEHKSKIETKDKFWFRPLGISGRDSFVAVIPKDYVKDTGMEKGDYLKVTRIGRQLILEPAVP
jgi:hypothetical protein